MILKYFFLRLNFFFCLSNFVLINLFEKIIKVERTSPFQIFIISPAGEGRSYAEGAQGDSDAVSL